MHNQPIIWKNSATNVANEPFLKVKQAKGYYYFVERAGVDSVAFILLDNNRKDAIGLINEPKPPLGDDVFLTTAFGGSLDKPLPLNKIVQEEVKEEAEYSVSLKQITPLGKVFVSTQMNQFCHLFLVDVTNCTPGERHLDENGFGSTVEWIHPKKLCTLHDWKAPLIYMKYCNNLINDLVKE